ncbi:MAG: hypothetical protein LBR44_02215 [Clostridiales Family XIII bacterium]|nr:hypothetical protein [Clostridiales Family XIII bacterium]
MLIKIAKLYYLGDRSQEQIAELLGISRPKVSRMLSLARQMKIVEFKISDSPLMISDMEGKLKERLGVEGVRIVPSAGSRQDTLGAVGQAAGEVLGGQLAPGMAVGISWGGTIDRVVSCFQPPRHYGGMKVVQLVGGIGTSAYPVDSRELTIEFAKKLGASYSVLQAPLLVSSKETKKVLLKEPELAAHFKLFSALDVCVIGIGSELPEQSVPYLAGAITLEEARRLCADGFITDICGSRVYRDGTVKPNDINDRVIAITPKQLKAVPRKIAVAAGSDKAATIVAAARGGFITTLVTDDVAAISILGEEG